MLNVLLLDLRASLRASRRNWVPPLLALAAVSLAAATVAALFSPIDALFLRPLPFGQHEQIHLLATAGAARPSPVSISPEIVRSLRDRRDVLQGVSAFAPGEPFGDTPVEAAREGLVGAGVDESFTDVLRAQPVAGRPLRASDGVAAGQARPALLSARVWRSRFGADPALLDTEVRLGGARLVIVGVMPDRFDFPNGTNVWTIRRRNPEWEQFHYLLAVVRLRDGVTPAAAAAALGMRTPPDGAADRQMLWPIDDAVMPEQSLTLFIFAGAALLTFIIGWLQLAGLQLGRLAGRAPELAVRAAIGASRRQILVAAGLDGMLLAVAGAALGAIILHPLSAMLGGLLPSEVIAGARPRADVRATVFLFALCALGGSACTWSIAGAAAPRSRTRASHPSGTLRALLTIAQMTVTALLLYVTCLLTVSYFTLNRQDLRFTTRGLFVVSPQMELTDIARVKRSLALLEQDVRAIEGVSQASLSDADPMGRGGLYRTVRTPSGAITARWRVVGADYRATLQARMMSGRWFDQRQDRGAQVVVVNETFARRAFGVAADRPRWVHDTIRRFDTIGVVEDMRNVSAGEGPEPEVYAPADASIFFAGRVIVRAGGAGSAETLARVSAAAKAAFPGAEPRVQSIDDILRVQQAPVRTRSQLLVMFTVAALLLSVIGVYASVTQLVAARWRELGVRAALGASPSGLARGILWLSVRAALAGAAAGCAAGFWIGQGLRAYLFGIEPASIWVPVTVSAVLVGTAVVAGLAPARRAGLINPADALRH